MANILKFYIAGDSTDGQKAVVGIDTKVKNATKTFAKWGAVSVAASAAMLVATTKASLGRIDALAKQADQIGINTEALATFQHLGELTGVSTEKMNSSLERMIKRLGEAATGTGAAKKALEGMNLEAQDLIKEKPEDSYRAIAASIREMGTQAEKSAAVAAIFGREGLSLLNTIEAGDEAFIQAAKDTELFGTAISRIDAAKVEQANDSFTRVGEVLQGVSSQLTVRLAPILEVISNRFVDSARESGGFTDQIIAGMEMAVSAIGFVADAIEGLKTVWKVAEIAVLGFVALTLTAWDELEKGITSIANLIPGLDIEPSSALSEWAETSRQVLMEANQELDDMVMAPRPSENIKKFFADVREEAAATAQAIADTKIIKPSAEEEEVNIITAANQKIIDSHADKYQKISEMAEELDLEERDRELLAQIRKEEAFEEDLEKLVENGLSVQEAEDMQRLAREESELIHKDNLAQIDERAADERIRQEERIGRERKNAMATALDNVLLVLANGNKTMFELGKKLQIATAIGDMYLGAQKAFTSLAGIPIIGPALGTAAAAAAILAGGVRIKQIKAQKYGQAHAGLDRNPEDQTIFMRKDEMILGPGTSKEVRAAAKERASGTAGGGSISIGQIIIQTTKDLRGMTTEDWEETMLNASSAIRNLVDSGVDFGMQPTEEFA